MEKVSGIKIGIDFGTCNIKVARWNNKKKRPQRVHIDSNQDNADYKIPNAIAYIENEDGSVDTVVGDAAIDSFEPENTVENIKYYLQKKEWSKYIPSLKRNLYIDDVLEDIFLYLKKAIEEQSGGKRLEAVTITTPVCFSEVQKGKIIQAASKAGLPIKEVISEPLAALFAMFDELENGKENIVLVFDFGGATLDLSLTEVRISEENTEISLLSSSGMIYGGLDVNEDILEKIFLEKYQDLKEFLNRQEQYENVKKDILNLVERMKRSVSKNREVEREWRPYTGEHFSIDLTLKDEEFVSMLKELGRDKKIQYEIDDLLEQASITKKDVTHLAIIGGSARIPFFKDLIANYFKNAKLIDVEDIYSVVSEGAVTYLNMLETSSLDFTNKLPYSVGYATEDGQFRSVIRKGARFGYQGRKDKVHMVDGRINVYQTFGDNGKSDIGEDETIIYMGYFDLKQYISMGEKLLVSFNLKKDGKLRLNLYDGRQGLGFVDLEMR